MKFQNKYQTIYGEIYDQDFDYKVYNRGKVCYIKYSFSKCLDIIEKIHEMAEKYEKKHGKSPKYVIMPIKYYLQLYVNDISDTIGDMVIISSNHVPLFCCTDTAPNEVIFAMSLGEF